MSRLVHFAIGADSEADKVHPSTFGLQIKSNNDSIGEPGQVFRQSTRVTSIPLHKTWGTQPYVYASHVRNLAAVPGSKMKPIDAYANPDGTYEVVDHHRTCAALLRGDTHINAHLWQLQPEG